jgi:hypothetical protein
MTSRRQVDQRAVRTMDSASRPSQTGVGRHWQIHAELVQQVTT